MFNIPRYKIAFLLIDTFLFLLFIVSVMILDHGNVIHINSIDLLAVIFENTLYLVIMIYLFRYNNLYKLNIILELPNHAYYLLKSILMTVLFYALMQFIIHPSNTVDIHFIIMMTAEMMVFYFLCRVFLSVKLYKLLLNNIFRRNILLIGDYDSSVTIANSLSKENNYGIRVIGFVDANKELFENYVPGITRLGSIPELESIVSKLKIDEIIIAANNNDYEELITLLDRCEKLNINVKVSSPLFSVLSDKMIGEKYSDTTVLDVVSHNTRKKYEKWKRVFDVIVALTIIIAFSPIISIICLMIRISSKGPIIYHQERIGRNGSRFMLYKFRTMRCIDKDDMLRKEQMLQFIHNSDRNSKPTKVINEKRVTKVGCFLRKTSLDELPQLFNVLIGDMSLVGPRPSLPYEYSEYKNWQKKRVGVLPGCTGIWQVLGRNTVSFIDSMVMDIYYIYKMSLLTDIECIFKTIPCMLLAKGK